MNEGTKDTKALKVVALRNRFFYIFYRYSMLIFFTSLTTAVLSTFFLIYFIKQPVPPQYVPVTGDGRLIALVPLDKPNKDDAEVQSTFINGLKKFYTYDYINYSDQIMDAAQYFTPKGFNDTLQAFKDSNTLLAVKENEQVVSFQAKGIPVITYKGIKDGVYTWALQVPITITFNGKQGKSLDATAYAIITRVSIVDNPNGMGINRLVVEQKIDNPQTNQQ